MDKASSTYTYQHDNVFSIGYFVYCSYGNLLSGYRFHRDKDCISWFAGELKNLAHEVKSILSANVVMDFTRDDWRKFNSATHCHICEKPFMKNDKRVRDHCHLTGRYRGPAHSNCNLNYKDSRCIPVVFHNLSGYDAHFIIKEIATAYDGNIVLLPITKQKYISFTKHVDDTKDENDEKNICVTLRFIDSYRFLASSLDKLASFLNKDKLRVLRREFSHLSDENFNLLTRIAYKFLEIGIAVGSMSHVEIAISDTRGNRIILPHATWTAFVEKRADIERLVQSTTPSSSLMIQDLVMELVKIRDVNTVKLSLCDKCTYMKPSTVLFILEQCVDHAYFNLCQYTNSVNDKFKYFVTYLRQNCIVNKFEAVNALRKVYDKNSNIECELIMYALGDIVYHAQHDE
ncbi:hypothetical protein ALC62_04436 [Cyphomyrmex costatus]|uniref:DNA-directed DNA polymerase n=1 Tax=Cyphomyrmex costatus TaxID=456900 RepID=A0A151IKA8_9HYME|nr:hypothetical protein ALC62_04436 [Cyphomyrmex costatus]